jgi:hypothetical protein
MEHIVQWGKKITEKFLVQPLLWALPAGSWLKPVFCLVTGTLHFKEVTSNLNPNFR